jgi:hypothetical protein
MTPEEQFAAHREWLISHGQQLDRITDEIRQLAEQNRVNAEQTAANSVSIARLAEIQIQTLDLVRAVAQEVRDLTARFDQYLRHRTNGQN